MIDREAIGKAFETAVRGTVGDIAPCYLAEAETSEYPFIVYNQTVTAQNTKDGIGALQSYLTAVVVSKDANEAEEVAGLVARAVRTGMEGFGIVPDTLDRDCTDNVWEITLTWTIRQHDMTPAGSGSGSGSGSGA
jgi:hypothetical protein